MKSRLAALALATLILPACGGGGDDAPPPPPPVPPAPPSLFDAEPAEGLIDLAWADTSGDESGFDLERAPDASGAPGAWTPLPSSPLPANSVSAQDADAAPGTPYWYRIRSFHSAGSSAWVQAGPAAALPPSGSLVMNFGAAGVVLGGGSFRASNLVVDGDRFYTAGYANPVFNDPAWRIEKRDSATGALDAAFDGDGVVTVNAGAADTAEYARALLIADGSLYVGGIGGSEWRIEKRSLATGALDPTFDGDGVLTYGSTVTSLYDLDGLRDMAADGAWLYIAGVTSTAYWRIEKRSLATGALDPTFGTGGALTYYTGSQVKTLVIDGTSMYVAGLGGGWRIEKRSLATGALDPAFDGDGVVLLPLTFPAGPTAMALGPGALYVAGTNNGGWRLEKRDTATGVLDAAFDVDGIVEADFSPNGGDAPESISLEGGDLYVAGIDYGPGNGQWRIEKRRADTAALVTAFDGDGVVDLNPASGTDYAYAVGVDGGALIVTGYQSSGPAGLRIEKRTR